MIAIRLGTIHSNLVGVLEPHQVAYLRSNLAYTTEDIDKIHQQVERRQTKNRKEFMEKKRILAWNGRTSLLTEKLLRFPTGLVPRVILLLEEMRIPWQIVDVRKRLENITWNPFWSHQTLRPYQQEAVDAAIMSEMGTIRVPTGGGKTRIAAGIISKLGRPSIFLVTRKDLMYQAMRAFKELMFHGESLIGQIGDGVFAPGFVTVATVQSLCAALGIKAKILDEDGERENVKEAHRYHDQALAMVERVEVLLFDEVQHIAAETALDVVQRCKHATYRFGLSATDWREDGLDLLIEGAVGPRLINMNMSDLVRLGHAVQPRIWTITVARPPAGCQYDGPRRWHDIYSYYYVHNDAFHDQVADVAKAWLDLGRTILTLVTSVEHGKRIQAACAARGIPGTFVSGTTSTARREKIFGDVMAGKLRHIIATSIADEGLDLPVLDALILAGGGKSSIKAIQRIGRIIRPAPGKTEGWVAECYCPDHDWFCAQYERRMEIYRNEPEFILH